MAFLGGMVEIAIIYLTNRCSLGETVEEGGFGYLLQANKH